MFSKKEQLKYIIKNKKQVKCIEKKCYELWRKIVVVRAGNRCQFYNCHKTNQLNAHHIFSKGRFKHLKYNTKNGLCLCPNHHTLGKESAHKDIFFKDKITGKKEGYRAIISEQELLTLERQAMSPYKLDVVLEYQYLLNEAKNYEIPFLRENNKRQV